MTALSFLLFSFFLSFFLSFCSTAQFPCHYSVAFLYSSRVGTASAVAAAFFSFDLLRKPPVADAGTKQLRLNQ